MKVLLRRRIDATEVAVEVAIEIAQIVQVKARGKPLAFVCVGTTTVVGDSVGPKIGTLLTKRGVAPVVGTNKSPLNALNLQGFRQPEGFFVVGVDASIGPASQVGTVYVVDGPIRPGLGAGRVLPEVGTIGVYICVADNFPGLMRVSKDFVNSAAEVVAAGLEGAWRSG